jgi:hypothetical protein
VNRQPQHFAALHPDYMSRCIACVLPHGPSGALINLASRYRNSFTLGGTGTVSATRRGEVARTLAGVNGYYTLLYTATAQPPQVWTMLAVVDIQSTGAARAIATFTEAPGNTTFDRSLYQDSGDAWHGYLFDGAERNATLAGVTTGPHVVALQCTGTAMTVFADGAAGAAQVLTNGGFVSYGSPEITIGYGGGGSGAPGAGGSATLTSDVNIAMFAFFDSALKEAELIALTKDPYRLFARTLEIPYFDVIGGGGGGTQTLSDAIVMTDEFIRGITRPRVLDEGAGVTDASIRRLIRGRVNSDTLTAFDDPNRTIQMVFNDESLDITDGFVSWRHIVRQFTESLTLADQLSKSVIGSGTLYTRTLTDAVEFADGFIRYVRYVRRTEDGVDVLDEFSKLIAGAGITYARILSDSVTMLDDAGNRWRFVRSQTTDTFALQDTVILGAVRGRVAGDVVALNDALTRWVRLVRLLGEDIEFSEGLVKIRGLTRTLGEDIELTDEAIRTLFLDQMQPVNFRLGVGAEPFVFGVGRKPFH